MPPLREKQRSRRPSLLWINQFATLPSEGGGTRHFDFGRELVHRGWDVTIVASDYHPQRRAYTRRADGATRAMIDETVDGVRFRWLWAAPYKENDWRRAANWLSFRRSVRAMPQLTGPPDVIIGSSPQLFAASAARDLARRLDVPFVLEVRDLWPESLVAAGGRKGIAYFALGRVASGLYRDAHRIIVLASGSAHYLVERGVDRSRIVHVPNGVDISVALPRSFEPTLADIDGGPTVLIYAGAHGPANGLKVALDAASVLGAEKPPVRFILIGDGPEKASLVASASERGLTNIEFRPPVPKSELAIMLRRADAGLMVLRDAELFSFAVSPNKLFDYMSAGIPVVCNVPGEVAELLAASAGGLQACDSSPEALADAIRRLRSLTPIERQRLGRDGRQWVERHHSSRVLGARLDSVLREVIAPKSK